MNLCSGCIISAKEYASGQQGVFCNEHLGSCLLCSFAGGQCANRRLFITLFSPFAFPQYQNPQECLLIYVKLLEDGMVIDRLEYLILNALCKCPCCNKGCSLGSDHFGQANLNRNKFSAQETKVPATTVFLHRAKCRLQHWVAS